LESKTKTTFYLKIFETPPTVTAMATTLALEQQQQLENYRRILSVNDLSIIDLILFLLVTPRRNRLESLSSKR